MSSNNWHDHPYTSPDESSDKDDESVEFDFEEYCGPKEVAEDVLEKVCVQDGNLHEEPRFILAENYCDCGCCSDSTSDEAICCQTWPDIVERTEGKFNCVTDISVFKNIIADKDGLEYSRFLRASSIKDHMKRHEYLSKPFTNNLKRNLLYQNFLTFVKRGKPLGKDKRIVLPNCVLSVERRQCPAADGEQYRGVCESGGEDS